MKTRTLAIVLAGGVAVALAARSLVPPGAKPPASPGAPDGAAASAAAPIGSATVGVYDDGLAVPERWVVFHDEGGAVAATVKTGADGKASGPMSAHGMVTVAYGTSVKQLVTVAGVAPGDELVVGEEEDEGAPEKTVCQARISLPGGPPKGARHVVALGVGTTEVPDPRVPLTTPVLERFIIEGKFPVLAEALGPDGEPVVFAHASVSGCLADAGVVDVKLPAWSTDYRTFTLDVTGEDQEGAAVAGELFILGQETDRLRRGQRQAPMRGRAVLRFTAPRPLGTHAAYELVAKRGSGGDRAVIMERRQAMPEQVTIDLRERLLPRVEGALVDGSGGARPTVRWRASAPAPHADGLVVRVSWPETSEHVWTLLAPPDRPSSLTLPALPEELASWRPDARPLTASAALVEASFVDGYADLKKRGLVALGDPPKKADVTVLRYSVSGALRF